MVRIRHVTSINRIDNRVDKNMPPYAIQNSIPGQKIITGQIWATAGIPDKIDKIVIIIGHGQSRRRPGMRQGKTRTIYRVGAAVIS